jgi:hypothetical protein
MFIRQKEKDEEMGLANFKKLRYVFKGDNTIIKDLLTQGFTAK